MKINEVKGMSLKVAADASRQQELRRAKNVPVLHISR